MYSPSFVTAFVSGVTAAVTSVTLTWFARPAAHSWLKIADHFANTPHHSHKFNKSVRSSRRMRRPRQRGAGALQPRDPRRPRAHRRGGGDKTGKTGGHVSDKIDAKYGSTTVAHHDRDGSCTGMMPVPRLCSLLKSSSAVLKKAGNVKEYLLPREAGWF